MHVHLVNPSHFSFGVGVMTPRWLYVIAAATPPGFGTPVIIDETLAPFDPAPVQPGDVVGIGIHSGNALRGYEVGRMARQRGAYVIFGGIHASLYPHEAHELGGAHAVVTGDGDVVWARAVGDCHNGGPQPFYEGGRIEADEFVSPRWDMIPPDGYMMASVQTVRGCPKHCSFCSVWRTDGQRPRQRVSDAVVAEIVELRRLGFRFIVLADDNFYPVTLSDLKLAERQNARERLSELQAMREERFRLMAQLAELPGDMVFFTQITMEAGEDPEFLEAMRKARILGALVGIESVTADGLKSIYKEFNCAGDILVQRLRTFRKHGVHVLGSFIFGLPTDRPDTFAATLALAQEAELTFAQFVLLTPFPGTVDFQRWEKMMETDPTRVGGVPLTRYWLIPQACRPKVLISHPLMSAEEVRRRTQTVWDGFYNLRSIWKRSRCVRNLRGRLAFVLMSALYPQMYGRTGVAADSARASRATTWARWLAKPARKLFRGAPMPDLQVPNGVWLRAKSPLVAEERRQPLVNLKLDA